MEIDAGVVSPLRHECCVLNLLNSSSQIENPEQYNTLPEKIFINKDVFIIGREPHNKVDAFVFYLHFRICIFILV